MKECEDLQRRLISLFREAGTIFQREASNCYVCKYSFKSRKDDTSGYGIDNQLLKLSRVVVVDVCRSPMGWYGGCLSLRRDVEAVSNLW